MPTNAQWTALTDAGAGDDGWKAPGNRLSGIVSNLPGGLNPFVPVFYDMQGTYWSSNGNIDEARALWLNSSNSTIWNGFTNKGFGISVVCIKN